MPIPIIALVPVAGSPSILDDDRQSPTFPWDYALSPILRINPLE
jgi:hypothetical protein